MGVAKTKLIFCGSLFVLTLFVKSIVNAQEFQNNGSEHHVFGDNYLRVNYVNDLFFHTDYYYTQGAHFEWVNPHLSKTLITHLLINRKSSKNRYGIGLESAGYTPNSIFSDTILHGDRPFAGMAYLQTFSMSINEKKRNRLNSVLSIGLMGPAAGGYEIQAFIHRYSGNPNPIGWKFQINNQIVLNYELNYEQAISKPNPYFLVSAFGLFRTGTLSSKAALGAVFMAGNFDNPYAKLKQGKSHFVYAYLHPQVELIGYDATLEGSPFTGKNPYVLEPGEINRITFRTSAGLVFGVKRYSLDFNARFISKEFKTGKTHLTGGFGFLVHF